MNTMNDYSEQNKNLSAEEIGYVVERINHLEKMFDDAKSAFYSDKSVIDDPAFQRKFSFLTQYMDSGQWLRDYSVDEKGLLPKDLKRGILSEDELYNFICDVEQAKKSANCPVKEFFRKIFKK